jgi:hypothetical protein
LLDQCSHFVEVLPVVELFCHHQVFHTLLANLVSQIAVDQDDPLDANRVDVVGSDGERNERVAPLAMLSVPVVERLKYDKHDNHVHCVVGEVLDPSHIVSRGRVPPELVLVLSSDHSPHV